MEPTEAVNGTPVRFVSRLKRRALARSTRTLVAQALATMLERHVGRVVRQIEKRPRRRDRQPASGIETEKVHTRPILHSNVGPNIEFGKR